MLVSSLSLLLIASAQCDRDLRSMAQRPPIDAAGHTPGNNRMLYTAVGYKVGEPEAGLIGSQLPVHRSHRWGERPTPANLR